ncbi:hypothetical protein [Helicobacter suis]|uniref:hypothetical protein n=1 Tax=Helicobacter suis TaxID=104628 RepID=UPI0013CF5212|nr:hypothetical protein [Helicobacter suis]
MQVLKHNTPDSQLFMQNNTMVVANVIKAHRIVPCVYSCLHYHFNSLFLLELLKSLGSVFESVINEK